MSSEADFYLNGLIYKHNCRIWGMGNPRAVDRSEREGKKVTVWCGITSSRVIGPYFFENESGSQETVSAQNYRDMIQNYLMPELEDTKGIWFTQDEYPAHNDRKAINLLKTIFDNRLISMNSIFKWPGYSPDLLATDFFLWGYLKERVFESNPKTLEDLKSNIENAIDGIEKSTLKKVFQNVIERMRLCEQSNGGHLNDVIHNI
uniref:DDE_3 domain-containing protein n=1 Tax=Strongyloides papillosus TaxID=174720 RepID=A0A0N5C0I2_STREA